MPTRLLARSIVSESIETRCGFPIPIRAKTRRRFLDFVEQNGRDAGRVTQFAIRDRSGTLIGGFGFEDLAVEHSAEIGYWLEESLWGRGYMTAVIGAGCRYAELTWGLVRITAGVFDFNRASARVLEKNGFRREGIQRKRYRKDGMFIDSIAYARIVP